MRAFLFYIDDWLSSKQIARMDATEERGYLRLLLYAATEPDCGLPNEEAELAIISMIGEQWGKVTIDPKKRFKGETSGKKVMRCFIEKDGRLYNERLLKEFGHQKEVARKRSEAGSRGGKQSSNSRQAIAQAFATAVATPSGTVLLPPLLPVLLKQTNQQTLTNDVCVCAYDSGSLEKTSTAEEKNINRGAFQPIFAFSILWESYPAAGRYDEHMSRGVFVGICDTWSDFDEIMGGLERWKLSELWVTRQAVKSILKWLSGRMFRETPMAATDSSARPRDGPKKTAREEDKARYLKNLENGGGDGETAIL